MNRQFIEDYAAGAEAPGRAIAGLSRDDLLAVPIPGTWSIQQIILHLMDSDLVGSDRFKRMAAMSRPAIQAYDESAYASLLGYERADIQMATELFRLNRLMTATVLRHLPDEAFHRVGLHSERGELALGPYVAEYTEHLEYHLQWVHKKRKLLGKPLA